METFSRKGEKMSGETVQVLKVGFEITLETDCNINDGNAVKLLPCLFFDYVEDTRLQCSFLCSS